jgi:hypothetical protein
MVLLPLLLGHLGRVIVLAGTASPVVPCQVSCPLSEITWIINPRLQKKPVHQ